MRVNLLGLLRVSAGAIDPKKDMGAYAYMLREIADHVQDVKDGKHTIEEFAEHYCMMEARK